LAAKAARPAYNAKIVVLLYEVSNEGLALCIHLLTRRGWYATNHTNPAGGAPKGPPSKYQGKRCRVSFKPI